MNHAIFTATCDGSILELRALAAGAAGAVLAAGSVERAELLAKLRAGEQVELLMEAQVYYQADGVHNRNFVRFKPSILAGFARSFKGAPYLRDHRQGDSLAVGGVILDSKLVKLADGGRAIHQQIQISAPWAVELALTGLTRSFSIGWNPTGPVLDSITGEKWNWSHYPGEKIVDDDGNVVAVAEVVFTAAEGLEASTVPIPAVRQVGVRGTRELAITLALENHCGPAPRNPGDRRMEILKKLASTLGLPESATLEEVCAKLAGQVLELTAERAAHQQTRDALTALTAEATALRVQVVSGRVDTLLADAVRGGKIKPAHGADGARVETALETAIRGMAGTLGIDVATSYVASLPVVSPVGAGPVASGTAPPRPAASPGISPAVRTVMNQMGLSEDKVLKHNPQLAA